MSVPKIIGGLGIKRVSWMNEALLANLGWRFLKNDESLV